LAAIGTVRFGYDGDGNLVTTTGPGGVVDTATFDSTDRMTGLTTAAGATTHSQL
jgi:YD repeat-containing protein